jgi:hypothetical protein
MYITVTVLYTLLTIAVLLSVTSLPMAVYASTHKKELKTIYVVKDVLEENVDAQGRLSVVGDTHMSASAISHNRVQVEGKLTCSNLILSNSLTVGNTVMRETDALGLRCQNNYAQVQLNPAIQLTSKNGIIDMSVLKNTDFIIDGYTKEIFNLKTNSSQFTAGLFDVPDGMFTIHLQITSEMNDVGNPELEPTEIQLVAYDNNIVHYLSSETGTHVNSTCVLRPTNLKLDGPGVDITTVATFPLSLTNGLGAHRLGVQINSNTDLKIILKMAIYQHT